MPNNLYKIGIPTDPTEEIKLLETIRKKHLALGADSPLKGLDWSGIESSLAKAAEQDALSDQYRSQAEKATGARDAAMPVVRDSIRSARDVLLGLNRKNPDALGDYGFKVSDSRSKATTPPKPSV
jgi:hypothetical protein